MPVPNLPQIKYVLCAFVVIRLLHDAWSFFVPWFFSLHEDSEKEKHLSPSEINDLLFWTRMGYAVGFCDTAIVVCIMFAYDSRWLREGHRLVYVVIALFYDAIIGLAIWGLLCLN